MARDTVAYLAGCLYEVMKIVSHETHLCRDSTKIVRLYHKIKSLSFSISDNDLACMIKSKKDHTVVVDTCNNYKLVAHFCASSKTSYHKPWICLCVEKVNDSSLDDKVVASCWNEGTRVISRHYTSWQSHGLDTCLANIMSMIPWHQWVPAKIPLIACGLVNGTYDIPIANTIPNDQLQDCIGSILTKFKRKNAHVINKVCKVLVSSGSQMTRSIADELSIIGLFNVHEQPGRSLSQNTCRVLFLQDMSLFEISKQDKNQIQKYQYSVDRSKQLYLRTSYSEGWLDIPGTIIDTHVGDCIVHKTLQVSNSKPIILWHVPLSNVLAVQGIGTKDTNLGSEIRTIQNHCNETNSQKSLVNSNDNTSTTPVYIPHTYQKLLDTYTSDALTDKMSCSPVSDTSMHPHLAVISALINISIS